MASTLREQLPKYERHFAEMAIFYDFCSLFQKPRTEEQDDHFREALSTMPVWYAHRLTTCYVNRARPVRLPDVRPYEERGCERTKTRIRHHPRAMLTTS